MKNIMKIDVPMTPEERFVTEGQPVMVIPLPFQVEPALTSAIDGLGNKIEAMAFQIEPALTGLEGTAQTTDLLQLLRQLTGHMAADWNMLRDILESGRIVSQVSWGPGQ